MQGLKIPGAREHPIEQEVVEKHEAGRSGADKNSIYKAV
jgi:hypothetical protein